MKKTQVFYCFLPYRFFGVVPALFFFLGCNGGPDRQAVQPERLSLRVVAAYPHDPEAFTQGLLWHAGKLYESTGLRGRSTLRRVDLQTGRVEQRVALDGKIFGEGLGLVGKRLFQLTWQSGKVLIWSLDDFSIIGEKPYSGEGWGICFQRGVLYMSDGSDRLQLRDPVTFREEGRVAIRSGGRPLAKLNELECVDGLVYANVWQKDEIVRIDPAVGEVTGIINASNLLTPSERKKADVLNGIAFVPETGRFLITGKLWPKLFEVEIVARGDGL